MKKLYLSLSLLCFIAGLSFGQRTVTGTIADTDGEPLIGASVLVKGTSIGSVADFDGTYSVDVPEDKNILVVSYTGYTQKEVEIGQSNIINITLEEGIDLGEVVVTALGVSREKKSLGYAVQEVEGEDLNVIQQSDAISSLAGRLSGVQLRQSSNLGGSKRLVIRGASSFFGENQPLIVLDGLPINNANYNSTATQAGSGGIDYGNMLNDLNPEDIESISVLKGTGAALYGSRAANGVVVINTKRAKAGKDQFSIDFNSSVSFEQVGVMPELQRKYGGGATVADANGGRDGFLVQNIEGTDYLVPQYGVDESWGPAYDPNINVLHWDAFSQDYPEDYLQPRPWTAPENDVRDFFETGSTFVNSLAISRSNQDFGIRFSYTNSSGTGVIPGSTLDKNTFVLNGNTNLLENLTANASLTYVRTKTKGRPTLGYPGSGQRYGNTFGQTLFQWTQRQIDYERSEQHWLNADGSQNSWNRNAWDDATPHYSDNHHWMAYKNFSDDERDRLLGNVGLSYEIVPGLALSGRVSGDMFTFYNRERVAVGSQAQSSYYEAVRNNFEYNFETRLEYNTTLSESLSLEAMVGGNQLRTRYHLNRQETSGGLVVADLYNVLNSGGAVLSNDYSEEKKVNSVFGRIALGYNNMLYLEGTLRNDWSSTLPEDNNSYFYPSLAGSFVFSEILNSSWLNYGKVRAGWAKIGKDTDPYNVLSTYSFNSDGTFQGVPRIFTPAELLNANLKPEQTTTWEIGVELRTLENRLGLDITYFDNVTEDQIIPLELSKSTGYDSKFINAGKIENNGIELTLTAVPVRTSNFDWTISANFTKIHNEVVEIVDGIDAMDIASAPFGGATLRASVGSEYGQLWGYDFIYDESGNRVVDEDGYWLRTQNLVPMGTVTPDFNLGISNNFTIGRLDIGFLLDIQQGGKFYSLSHQWGHYSGVWAPTAAVNDQGNEIRSPVSEGGGIKVDAVIGTVEYNEDGTYTVTNTRPNDVYIPGQAWGQNHYYGFGTPSAQSVFDADYIKLRELSVGYSFNMGATTLVKTLRVTAFGRNLWVGGLDYEGLDPEVTVNGSGNIQGMEGGFLPTTRFFGAKLSLGL